MELFMTLPGEPGVGVEVSLNEAMAWAGRRRHDQWDPLVSDLTYSMHNRARSERFGHADGDIAVVHPNCPWIVVVCKAALKKALPSLALHIHAAIPDLALLALKEPTRLIRVEARANPIPADLRIFHALYIQTCAKLVPVPSCVPCNARSHGDNHHRLFTFNICLNGEDLGLGTNRCGNCIQNDDGCDYGTHNQTPNYSAPRYDPVTRRGFYDLPLQGPSGEVGGEFYKSAEDLEREERERQHDLQEIADGTDEI